MDTLSSLIKKILGSNPALQQGLQDARIIETWPLAVGELLAKHTHAVQVKNKTLMIEVDHPIWKQELHSNKQLAIRKLNEKLAEVLANDPSPKKNTEQVWIEDIFLLSPKSSGTKAKTELK